MRRQPGSLVARFHFYLLYFQRSQIRIPKCVRSAEQIAFSGVKHPKNGHIQTGELSSSFCEVHIRYARETDLFELSDRRSGIASPRVGWPKKCLINAFH